MKENETVTEDSPPLQPNELRLAMTGEDPPRYFSLSFDNVGEVLTLIARLTEIAYWLSGRIYNDVLGQLSSIGVLPNAGVDAGTNETEP
jgi:hypothetical protein